MALVDTTATNNAQDDRPTKAQTLDDNLHGNVMTATDISKRFILPKVAKAPAFPSY
jgi:hypothetical protein